ncbi:MAG: hypothetical protein RLW42_09115, partial [Gammaproteobacteria bacterium]
GAAQDAADAPGAVALLTLAFAVPAMILSLGPQQRFFYMLPALVPMCVLAARGLVLLGRRRPRTVLGLLLAQGLVVAVAAGWVGWSGWTAGRTGDAGWLLVAALAGIGGARWMRSDRPARVFVVVIVLAAGTFAIAARQGLLWSDDRRHTYALGSALGDIVADAAPLYAYRLTPAVYVYASNRSIPRLADPPALQAALARAREPLWVLMETREAKAVATLGQLEPVHLMPVGAPDRSGLYRLSAPEKPPGEEK